MEISELKDKTEIELKEILAEQNQSEREARFLAAGGELKHAHQLKEIKKTKARINTVLNARLRLQTAK